MNYKVGKRTFYIFPLCSFIVLQCIHFRSKKAGTVSGYWGCQRNYIQSQPIEYLLGRANTIMDTSIIGVSQVYITFPPTFPPLLMPTLTFPFNFGKTPHHFSVS